MVEARLDLPDFSGKRERTKAANRAAILEAASRVFAELGYETATVRDIISRTGLASGTFYNYFKSKEEVFIALADDGARRFRPVLRDILETAQSFEEYIGRALKAYFSFLADEAENFGTEQVIARDLVLPNLTPETLAVHEEVVHGVRSLIARGLAPEVDAEFLARGCIGLAQGVGRAMMAHRPPDVDAAVAFTAKFILEGLAGVGRQA